MNTAQVIHAAEQNGFCQAYLPAEVAEDPRITDASAPRSRARAPRALDAVARAPYASLGEVGRPRAACCGTQWQGGPWWETAPGEARAARARVARHGATVQKFNSARARARCSVLGLPPAPRARGPKRHVRWGVFACAQDALGLCVGADALRTSKSASTAALASCVLRW